MSSESKKLTQVTSVVRGLLSQPTDDADNPFEHIILRTLSSGEAVSFASSAKNADAGQYPEPLVKSDNPPLFLSDTESDKLRDSISKYAKQYKDNPSIVCLKDLGILYVEQSESDSTLPLKNKVAVVTGAAGAIGYGICQGLLESGCRVAATDLAGKKLDDFGAELDKSWPGRVISPAIDVTDEDSISRGFETIIETWGGIDILVVNAGIPMVSHLIDMDIETFRKLEKVNIEGAMLTLSAIGRHFISQGIGGDVIVISTKNVPSPGAGFGGYSATKAACHQLGRIASLELAQYGVRVNMVAPDAVFEQGKYKSGLWQEIGPDRMKARGLDEKQLQEYYQNRNLLKAKVTGRHVANAVLFFATRQTPTTGATIPVDGGLPDATPR
ncbi:MAG: SDR family NAD(P)-dependent oxidoreductase [Planctomycetes bacterium]|nr:SDR family NAD(P)-dependent oxidoreductase [Planctomycetota bacterium]